MVFFFQLFSLVPAVVDYLPPSHPIASMLLYHTISLHVLLHYIHQLPLRVSSFPSA